MLGHRDAVDAARIVEVNLIDERPPLIDRNVVRDPQPEFHEPWWPLLVRAVLRCQMLRRCRTRLGVFAGHRSLMRSIPPLGTEVARPNDQGGDRRESLVSLGQRTASSQIDASLCSVLPERFTCDVEQPRSVGVLEAKVLEKDCATG